MASINDINEQLGFKVKNRNVYLGNPNSTAEQQSGYSNDLINLSTQKDLYDFARTKGFTNEDSSRDLGTSVEDFLRSKNLYDSAASEAGFLNKAKKYGYAGTDLNEAIGFVDSYQNASKISGNAGIAIPQGATLQQISDAAVLPANQDKFNQAAQGMERTAESVKEDYAEQYGPGPEVEEEMNTKEGQPGSNSVRIQTPDGIVHSVMKGSSAEKKYMAAGGKMTQAEKTDNAMAGGGQQDGGGAPPAMDVITDPVTGQSYARDLAIPGSTYKPYTPQPQAPASTIAPPDPTPTEEYLGDYGYSLSEGADKKFKIAPAKSFKEVYEGVWESLELDDVKKQVDKFQKEVSKLDQELAEKTADINENPWYTEGVRVREIQKLQDRYDLKKAPFASNLEIAVDLYNNGREEARYVATQALNQYNSEREFQLDQIEFMADQAEKKREAQVKAIEAANKEKKYESGIIGEYQFAVENGYKGTFSQYQNEDSNRRKSIAQSSTPGTPKTEEERKEVKVGEYSAAINSGNPLPDGTPILDNNGLITPVAWNKLIADFGDRKEFIERFGYLMYTDKGKIPSSYNLTAAEQKLILGT